MRKRKVCIAVPAYGHLVQSACLESIVQTQYALLSMGVGCVLRTASISDVAAARNTLATQFVRDGTCSHLLFVDADTAFPPQAVLRLLQANKGVIGCAYPVKSLDLTALIRRAREHPRYRVRQVVAGVQRYVVKHLPGPPRIVDGLCSVAGVGMGLCLIRAGTLATIEKRGSISRRTGPAFWSSREIGGPLLGFFDPLRLGSGYLSEDFSFCVRWRRCGGRVFALVTEDVAHIGPAVYSGPYLDTLAAESSHRGRVQRRRR